MRLPPEVHREKKSEALAVQSAEMLELFDGQTFSTNKCRCGWRTEQN